MQERQREESAKVIDQIQQKLAEQTQLIGILDEQLTNQEEKVDTLIKQQTDFSHQLVNMNQNGGANVQSNQEPRPFDDEALVKRVLDELS